MAQGSSVPERSSLSSWARYLLVVGPDPPLPDATGRVHAHDRLLPWPARLIAAAVFLAAGLAFAQQPGGIQLAWALQYSLLVAVSVVTSFWFPLLLLNLAIAAAWLAISWRSPTPDDDVPVWGLSDIVTWLNRQVGHVEAAATWTAVALVISHSLTFQLGLLGVVAFLGTPAVNGLARTELFGGAEARSSRAALLMERRSLIYFATFLGLVVIAAQAPKQLLGILPLVLTILPGLSLRYVRFRVRKSQERRSRTSGRESVRALRLERAERQVRASRMTGWVAPVLVASFFCLVAGISHWHRVSVAEHAAAAEDGPAPPAKKCVPEPGGPVVPTLALLLLADTQIHELGRHRFPGQMEIANALVPVCRRPVELDMLAAVPVVRYASVYDNLRKDRAAKGLSPAMWAHLGDLADLSCVGELDRMVDLLRAYAPDDRLLAGIALGNHDSTFQGNFDWSPYWDVACSERLDKRGLDDRLGRMLGERLSPAGRSETISGWAPAAFFGRTPLSRFTITRLGTLPAGVGARGVLGVFLDTSDRLARDYGIAGSYGTFSSGQREEILARVRAIRKASFGTSWADPWLVLFGHVPYGELTSRGQQELEGLVTDLDRLDRLREPSNTGASRVIALVTAHTHVAGSHRHCMGKRLVREIVLGSVIDPPQQASLLEIGLDGQGHAAARLATMPSVSRPDFTCSASNTLLAKTCGDIVKGLENVPACRGLLGGVDGHPQTSAMCDALEENLSDKVLLEGIARHGGPDSPRELEDADTKRARALLECICRPEPGMPPLPGCADAIAEPLNGEAYASVVEAAARAPQRADEMSCLAWAASALQSHKAAGMTMSGALHCAFTDETLPAAQVTVASAEEVPCL